MKEGWKTKPFGEILMKTETVNPCLSPEKEFDYIDVSSVSNETFNIERTQKLKGKDAPSRARRLVRTNDILFATIRPTLKRIAIVPEYLDKQVCSTGFFVLRPEPEIDHRFVFYSLFTEHFMRQMEGLQKGASYPAVTDGEIRAQLLSYPSLPEQHRIVALLDEAFAGIATARANTERNLQNARAVFESAREDALAPRRGWLTSPLGVLCKIKHGFAFKGEFFAESGQFVLLTPGSFYEHGGYRERGEKTKYYVGEIPPEFILNEGDMLTAMTEQAAGLLGSPLIVPESGRFLHNQRLGLFVTTPGKPWFSRFFFHTMNLARVRKEIHDSGSGAKVRHTSPGRIQSVQVSYPSTEEEQRAVAKCLDELATECERLESLYQRKLAALDELKQSLLHQAFIGEL